MDKAGFGVIGSFTLNDGEQIVAEVSCFEQKVNELVVQTK
jgi:hypothetical protein